MSLAEIAKQTDQTFMPSVCQVCQVLDEIDPDSRTVLIGWLQSNNLRYTQIRDYIKADPDTRNLSEFSLSRHASGTRDTCLERGGQRAGAR